MMDISTCVEGAFEENDAQSSHPIPVNMSHPSINPVYVIYSRK